MPTANRVSKVRVQLSMAEHVELRDPFVAALDAMLGRATRGVDPERADAIRSALALEAYRWSARLLDAEFPPELELDPPAAEETSPFGALLIVDGEKPAPAPALPAVTCSVCHEPLGSKHYAGVPGAGDLCVPCWSRR